MEPSCTPHMCPILDSYLGGDATLVESALHALARDHGII